MPLYGGNTGLVAENSMYSSRTKRHCSQIFFLKELLKEGNVILHHIRTQDRLAGIATKYLSEEAHRHFIELIDGSWCKMVRKW